LHPSHEYLVVIACHLYIFNIKTGEICAKIPLPLDYTGKFLIDKSGLYALIATTKTLLLYELGTGR